MKIEEEIKTAASEKLAGFGIAVLDFRIKRVNYNPEVLDRIYQRMISERLRSHSAFVPRVRVNPRALQASASAT